MFVKYLNLTARGYKVVKSCTDVGPLPSMIQYQLQSDQGEILSFWNDIPFGLQNDVVNCVVQIPKQKHGKFQVKKNIPNHPIMQDTRKNIFSKQLQLRFYNQFPLFNYGFIPQTWQQSIEKDSLGRFVHQFLCSLQGDDDPIDICDLSTVPKTPGQIFRGRVLGGFCLIDQGEIDWKILVVDQQESRKSHINKVEDVNPRLMSSLKKWFKVVKVPDGKPANTIAYDQKIFNKQQTIENILKTRKDWIELMKGEGQPIKAMRKKHNIQKRYLNIDK